jgi:hypothetical protein
MDYLGVNCASPTFFFLLDCKKYLDKDLITTLVKMGENSQTVHSHIFVARTAESTIK